MVIEEEDDEEEEEKINELKSLQNQVKI